MSKCDRCGKDASELKPVTMPVLDANRDGIRRHLVKTRKICDDCLKSLSMWWYAPKVEGTHATTLEG